MVCNAVDRYNPDQRFVNQAGDGVCNLHCIKLMVGCYGLGSLECEQTDKYRKSAEHASVPIGQEIEAPVQHGSHCLMTRGGGSASLPKELEPIAQQVSRTLKTIGTNPASGQFDRKRYAIQSTADRRHCWCIGVG